jgi:hypothetical protein
MLPEFKGLSYKDVCTLLNEYCFYDHSYALLARRPGQNRGAKAV